MTIHGLTIGIAQVSSPFDRTLFDQGVAVLKKLGFSVIYDESIFSRDGYLVGSDRDRAQHFTELYCDPAVDAILFARGGYGAQRMIAHLDPERFHSHRKPVVGYSDLTPLLAWLHQTCNIPIFYGPVVTALGKPHAVEMEQSLVQALTSSLPTLLPVSTASTLRAGEGRGKLVGGCLSLIASSIGTPYELDTREAILFIEDIDEKTYALDRMLTQLINAGHLMICRGIIAGSLIPRTPAEPSVHSMLLDRLSDFPGPIVVDYPAGHTDAMLTLPLGREIVLRAPERGIPVITLCST